ncbi:MAG: M48 family metallopeptidase [Prevotellaceae bacterium]|jgi:Zn-dependent protease with chaperone function|nr:M48 family metallopeptidase [Prevotellaceae bacterium]
MKRNLTILFLLCFSLANAQFSDFTYLKSEGEMPQPLADALKSKDKEIQFFLDLVKDGRIIYGSELNIYVDKIVENLLKNNKDLRQKISVYILKSPAVNATAMKSSNIILVNIGLLAQARNESELAWIIGHEIAHTTFPNDKKYREIKSLNDFLAYNHGSREEENRADKVSFDEYFKNSAYSANAVKGVFDVLRYGYLPFDETAFPKTEVEENFYHFDEKYFLTAIKPIRSRDDYIDTLSTHPNIKKREEALLKMLANTDNNGEINPQGDALFDKIQNLARLECINYYLTFHIYDRAIYNIFILQKEFSDNKFLETANAAAYYGFSKHKTNNSEENVIADYKEVEGEMQQVSFFLNKINKKEANLLAVRKLMLALKKYPNDDFLGKMINDVLVDLIKENSMTLEDFSDFAKDAQIDTTSIVQMENVDNQQDKQDKYSKIKSKKQQLILPKEKFKTANYMLVDWKTDSLFLSFYKNSLTESEDNEILNVAKSQNAVIKQNEKILILYPSFAKYNRRKKEYSYPYLQNSMFQNAIKQSVKSLKINYDMISTTSEIKSTDDFNKAAIIGQWRAEFRQVDFPRMQFYQQRFLKNKFADEFRYINIALQRSEKARFFTGFKSQIFYRIPLIPLSFPMEIALFALPNSEKTLYFALYDIETGETVFLRKHSITDVGSSAYINQILYNFYYSLKKDNR